MCVITFVSMPVHKWRETKIQREWRFESTRERESKRGGGRDCVFIYSEREEECVYKHSERVSVCLYIVRE